MGNGWGRLFLEGFGDKALRTCGCNNGHQLCGHRASEKQAMEKSQDDELVVYFFKSITTMNPTFPRAKAVAVHRGRVVSIGNNLHDVRPWIKRAAAQGLAVRECWDFSDKVAYPGFIEPHCHPLIGGTALQLPCIAFHDTPVPNGPDIPGCKTKAEVLERLREEERKLTDAKSAADLLVWGWDTIAMKGAHLTASDLDEISTTRVIAVWDCSMHNGYVNTKGLAKAHLHSGCKTWRAWLTLRKAQQCHGLLKKENGEPLGVFLGIEAMYFIMPILRQVFEVRRCLTAIDHISDLARENGITFVAEMFLGVFALPLEIKIFDAYYNDRRGQSCAKMGRGAKQRCVAVIKADKAIKFLGGIFQSVKAAVASVAALQRTSTPMLIFNNGVKFFCDDAFMSLTMRMAYPGYTDGHKGIWNTSPGLPFVREMLPWWRGGARIHVHSNGDEAQDATCEALAALQRAHPRFDHRFCFEHFGQSSQALIRRVKALGANVSCNPQYCHLRGELFEEHMGKDRAHASSRLGMLVRNNITTAMHSDVPVAPPRPLHEMWVACTRRSVANETQMLAPEERITIHQALKMKTIDAAAVIGCDDFIGSVEAGKFADLVVLDKDLEAIDVEDLRSVKICATILGGEVVRPGQRPACVKEAPAGFWRGIVWLMARTAEGRLARSFWGFVEQLCFAKEIAKERWNKVD